MRETLIKYTLETSNRKRRNLKELRPIVRKECRRQEDRNAAEIS